ncbi:MAG TPA: hypothetical protein PLY72_11785 [Candidatus Obscuribacter sp.]|nr:hypothetical protein [Candidatus Obscuribacter sp.]HNG75134.1 hypothetical protein [Candidatus Obscuribacter sp.]
MSKKPIKSSMSPEARAQRRAIVGKAATEKIAKSEQLNFRLEEKSINELQELAFRRGLPVGTMIREWVLERLSRERLGTPQLADRALHVLDEIHTKLTILFEQDHNTYAETQSKGKTCRASERTANTTRTPGFTEQLISHLDSSSCYATTKGPLPGPAQGPSFHGGMEAVDSSDLETFKEENAALKQLLGQKELEIAAMKARLDAH